MSKHSFVHVEFAAEDPKAASKFYAALFGWKIEAQPEMDYVMFDVEPGPGGGFPKADGETYKKGDVIVYVSTDDIEATLAKVGELGGKTLLPKTEIPNMGWFAFFSDPSGNRVGLYTGMNA
jgi:predicted enzyme related to lactoylglutathione lyase